MLIWLSNAYLWCNSIEYHPRTAAILLQSAAYNQKTRVFPPKKTRRFSDQEPTVRTCQNFGRSFLNLDLVHLTVVYCQINLLFYQEGILVSLLLMKVTNWNRECQL